MNTNRRRANPFWGLVVLAATAFCVTILAYLASGLGNPATPLNQFFTRHGFRLVCGEAAFIVVTGMLALGVDRRHTLRRGRQSPADAAREPGRDD